MKSSIEKNEGLVRKVTVSVPEADVNEAFKNVYEYINNTVSIKGFRKGKVPISKIRGLYADKARQDVAENLVNRGYEFAIREHSLAPLGNPHIHVNEKLEENKEFSFSAEFEVKPEVVIKKMEGLEVEKEIFAVNDSEINDVLENIRKSNSTEVPILIDRPAEMGDVAEIDFFGTINGVPLEKGAAENFKIELGSKSFIEGFEEGLVGMNPGVETTISLKFPEGYHEAKLAGQPVDFKVKLHKLFKKEMPEINDELAKKVGDFENVDALKEAIKKDIESREMGRIEEDVNARIIEKLVEENPVEVPQQIKNNQKAQIIEDSRQKMQQQGMTPENFEEYKKKWDHQFEDTAAFMVKSTFLVDEISKTNNISCSEEDVEERIQMHSLQMGLPLDKLKEFYEKDGRKGNLRFQLTQEKVIEFLKSKAKITELPKDKLTENQDKKEA